jgi:hypothetical protein
MYILADFGIVKQANKQLKKLYEYKKAFGKTDLFDESDFNAVLTPEEFENLKLKSKVRSMII